MNNISYTVLFYIVVISLIILTNTANADVKFFSMIVCGMTLLHVGRRLDDDNNT